MKLICRFLMYFNGVTEPTRPSVAAKLSPCLLGVVVAASMFALPSGANATIIYHLDRAVGEGAVTGFIETDGTIGVLSEANLVAAEITISAPDLNAVGTAVFGTGDQFSIFGDAFTATASNLLFDFSFAADSLVLFQNDALPGSTKNFWCLLTSGLGCGVSGGGEQIGGLPVGVSQRVAREGNVIVASVQQVPEPGSLALLLAGLGGFCFMARKRAVSARGLDLVRT